MRDVKRRMENYSFYDRSGIAAHLEAMAAKGWQLEHMTNLIWTYRRLRAAEAALRCHVLPRRLGL